MILCLVYIYMMAVVDNICIYVTVDNNNIYIYVAVARGVTTATDPVLKPLTPPKLLNLHSLFIHFLCSKRFSCKILATQLSSLLQFPPGSIIELSNSTMALPPASTSILTLALTVLYEGLNR